jgi:hydrogenase nickel incorporation protein HypA/HybF
MHEIKIAEDLSLIILEEAARAELSVVTKVNITFGQMVAIVPHIFEFAFRETVRGSIAEDAEIEIEVVPLKMKCKDCGTAFLVSESLFACTACGATDLELLEGKELFIKSIEGE